MNRPANDPMGGQGQGTASPIYPAPAEGVSRLRWGLLLDGPIQPLWVDWLIEAVESAGMAELSRLFVLSSSPSGRHAGQETPTARAVRFIYEKFDARRARRHIATPDPCQASDLTIRFQPSTSLTALRSASNGLLCLTTEGLEAVRHADLDILLWLGQGRWTGGVLGAARIGMWTYFYAGCAEPNDHAGLFAALGLGRSMTSCVLARLAEPGQRPAPIQRLAITFRPRSLNVMRRKTGVASVLLLHRALLDLQSRSGKERGELASGDASLEDVQGEDGEVGDLQVLSMLPRLAFRWAGLRWQIRRGTSWFIALRRRARPSFADGDKADRLAGFVPLSSPPGHFHADPFLFEEAGTTHLLFEDFDRSRGKGAIACCRLTADGTPTAQQTILERPYHLSYPFVFRWDGAIFMVPESGQNRTVDLYRCDAFPGSWTLVTTLIRGWHATDSTLLQAEDGSWWMFTAIDERGVGPALFLFQAPSLLGPWRPHPRNPIQTDPRYSRPAGRLLRRNGRLLRPAQDGSLRYGGAMWLMEVLTLDGEAYAERPLLRAGPEWLAGNLCLHHYDATDDFEVIDGMRPNPPPAA